MQLAARTPRASERGYTLGEVLVSITLALLAVAAGGAFNRFQLFALRNQVGQIDVQSEARSVLELFAREVRRAGTNPTCAPGVSALADAKQHLLRVQADLDGDGTVTGANEDITYEYRFDQNRVLRTANGKTEALVTSADVTGSRIRYFDLNGAEVTAGSTGLSGAQRDNVRRVRVELTLAAHAVDPQSSLPLQARVASDIDLRNRFFVSKVTCP